MLCMIVFEMFDFGKFLLDNEPNNNSLLSPKKAKQIFT